MSNLNKVIMQGNIVRDPECTTVSDKPVCKFTIACNTKFKNSEEVCFMDVTAWQGLATLVQKYLLKGRSVLVEGRIKQESWITKEGKQSSKHIILASEIIFLDKPLESKDMINPKKFVEDASFGE